MFAWGPTVAEEAFVQEAAKVAEALNLLYVLAAPRLYSQWCTQASPSELHSVLSSRLETLAAFCEKTWGSADAERFRNAAPRVRAFAEMVARAEPTRPFEPAWTSLARECLEALGIAEPPGGWAAFEGWPTPG